MHRRPANTDPAVINHELKMVLVPNEFSRFRCRGPPPYSKMDMEEEFYHYYLEHRPRHFNQTWIYLPVAWRAYYCYNCDYGRNEEGIKRLGKWLCKLDPAFKYWTVLEYSTGIHNKANLAHIDLHVFGTSVKFSDGTPPETYIPLIRRELLSKEMPRHDRATALISFCGNEENDRRTGTRDKVLQELKRAGDVVNLRMTKDAGLLPFDRYVDHLLSAKYALAPRGWGPTSFRFYEAMFARRVPVYIWKDHCCLPFPEWINWQECAIVLKDTQVPCMVAAIKADEHITGRYDMRIKAIERALPRLADWKWNVLSTVQVRCIERAHAEPRPSSSSAAAAEEAFLSDSAMVTAQGPITAVVARATAVLSSSRSPFSILDSLSASDSATSTPPKL